MRRAILLSAALSFLPAAVSAALPAQVRQVELDRGFYLSGGTAYVATYSKYLVLSQEEAERYANQGPNFALDLAGRAECLRESSGTGCVFVPKGGLVLTAALPESDLAGLSSREQVAAALRSDISASPRLASGGALLREFPALLASLRSSGTNFLSRYLAVLNRVSYPSGDRSAQALHSGVEAWSSGVGVCDAYSRLALYAAAVSGLPARVATGDAWDDATGKITPHAWLEISKFLFDPTFDDASLVAADGTEIDAQKSAATLKYFGLSGAAALADRAPDGTPAKDLSPDATARRYFLVSGGSFPRTATRLLEPYLKRRALGMSATDAAPTAAQLAAVSVNGAEVPMAADLSYRCGAGTCSASGRNYLPLNAGNLRYVFSNFSLAKIRSLSVVRMKDGASAAFAPEGEGL